VCIHIRIPGRINATLMKKEVGQIKLTPFCSPVCIVTVIVTYYCNYYCIFQSNTTLLSYLKNENCIALP
jgi:hypothetical protein